VVISIQGSAGFVSWYTVPIFVTHHAVHVEVIEGVSVKKQYIYYALSACQEDIYKLRKGSAQPGITKTDLKAFKIPLPKDPSFQAQLQPHFDELDALRQQVKTHEAEYKQALVELREAALEE
jgi:restriction endonuclease S subunit